MFSSSPHFYLFLPGSSQPVSPVRVCEMFVSAEPDAVAQCKGNWSELGLESQGGLLGS